MFDLRPRLVHSFKNRQTFFNDSVDLPCPVCGQAVTFAPRSSGVLCGHCGSPLHRQADDATPVGPTGILPFRLSEEDAHAKLAAATEPAEAAVGPAGQLRRVYVPYWHVAAHIASSWSIADPAHMNALDPEGHVTVDDEQLLPAGAADGAMLVDLPRKCGAQATAYEPSRLAGIEVWTPTVALVEAWSEACAKWQARLKKKIRVKHGWLEPGERVNLIVTTYSNERAGLLLAPVYLPDAPAGAAPFPLAVDAYSGAILRALETRVDPQPNPHVDATETAQLSEAFIGRAVLAVIGGVLLLFGLWFAQRLWFY